MEAVKKTVAENMGISGAHTLISEGEQFKLEDTPDLSGKVAVITGEDNATTYANYAGLTVQAVPRVSGTGQFIPTSHTTLPRSSSSQSRKK